MLDTGFWSSSGLVKDNSSTLRVLKQYDAISDTTYAKLTSDDDSGHGAHVTGIAMSSNTSNTHLYHGVAPGARLVSVKAFRADGSSTYADVIRGIDWVVANRTKFNIRVLNCSFSAPVRSWYWEDPLNQAVMRAWRAGIVVVVSAGNRGPNPQTIGVPGNVPYVVTVGAMSDDYTPADGSDDRLATWSSTGPTFEGFVKPDLVAPGGHVLSLMDKFDYVPTMYPQFHDGNVYFTMSGTSQAAAVVSGVAAQILSANPALGNNDVKCALIATVRVAIDGQGGGAAYSIFQQGAGLVDAYGAVYSGATGCANQGLDVHAELDKKPTHYVGVAYQDTDGLYHLYNEGGQGTTWNGAYNGVSGYRGAPGSHGRTATAGPTTTAGPQAIRGRTAIRPAPPGPPATLGRPGTRGRTALPRPRRSTPGSRRNSQAAAGQLAHAAGDGRRAPSPRPCPFRTAANRLVPDARPLGSRNRD